MTINWVMRGLLGIALIWCGIVYGVLFWWGKAVWTKRRAGKQHKRRPKWYKEPKCFEGLAHRPVCALCEESEQQQQVMVRERPPQIKAKRGPKRKVDTANHYCPNSLCRYYGWLGCGNIRSNGHPNEGRWRQLECVVCKTFFMETKGTLFYGNRVPAKVILWAIAA